MAAARVVSSDNMSRLQYSQNIEGASLFVHGYHWLPLATVDLVGDNREFEV